MRKVLFLTIVWVGVAMAQCVPGFDPIQQKITCSPRSGIANYPGAGISVSTGSDWGTSIVPGAAGHVIRSNGTSYADSAIGAGDLPGSGVTTINSIPCTVGSSCTITAVAIPLAQVTLGDPGYASPVLAVDNSQIGQFLNLGSALTITDVYCYGDPGGAGTTTVNPKITGGANILVTPLACPAGSWGHVGGLSVTQGTNASIDFNLVAVDGTTKQVSVLIIRN